MVPERQFMADTKQEEVTSLEWVSSIWESIEKIIQESGGAN